MKSLQLFSMQHFLLGSSWVVVFVLFFLHFLYGASKAIIMMLVTQNSLFCGLLMFPHFLLLLFLFSTLPFLFSSLPIDIRVSFPRLN